MVWLHGTRKKNVQQGFLLCPRILSKNAPHCRHPSRAVAVPDVKRRARTDRTGRSRRGKTGSLARHPPCRSSFPVQKVRPFVRHHADSTGNDLASRLQLRRTAILRTAILKDEGAKVFPDAPGKVSHSRTSKRETACSSPSSQLRLWGHAAPTCPSCHQGVGFTLCPRSPSADVFPSLLRQAPCSEKLPDSRPRLSGISPLSRPARFALTHRSGLSRFRHGRSRPSFRTSANRAGRGLPLSCPVPSLTARHRPCPSLSGGRLSSVCPLGSADTSRRPFSVPAAEKETFLSSPTEGVVILLYHQ